MYGEVKWSPSILGAACLTLGIALMALLPAIPAAAAEVRSGLPGTHSSPATIITVSSGTTAPPRPQLSIAIDNGRTSVAVGDRSRYTVTVRNLGGTPVTGLLVTQTVPTGLGFRSADSGGAAKAGMVSWRVDLKAASETTLHTTMTVSKTPNDLLRLATVACARVVEKGPPIVCATHSDQLPAGASAEASEAKNANGAGAATKTTGANRWDLVVGLAGVAAIVGAFMALTARRRKSRSPVGPPPLDEHPDKSRCR